MPDQLSTLYNSLLEGSYDGVDRVVLNAYFGRGQFGGGFRIWGRALQGSDENLDDNHLMRMAGRFSRRLRAWAKENELPVGYRSPGERKQGLASGHLALHAAVRGAGEAERSRVCGLSGAESRSRLHQTGQLLYNRHQHRGSGESRRYLVCATDGRALAPLCERWIYSTCLCFALDVEEQKHTTEGEGYRGGRSLLCFPAIVIRLRSILDRFLNAVGCMNACFVSDGTLEKLPEPAPIGHTKVGGIDLNQPRMRRVTETVLALSASSAAFTASDLVRQVHSMSGQPESEYGARWPAYDIQKLRAKGMVSKLGKSRRHEAVPQGCDR